MTAPARIQQQPGVSLVREKVSSILSSEEARRHIAPLLSPGVSLERVVSTIYQVAADNPEILDCTPASLIMAVGRGVKWDLEFGETVHLVPFNVKTSKKGQPDQWEKRAKAIRDFKGDIELVVRSGAARAVQAHCFYANEHFKYELGTTPYIEHHPIVDPTKRGAMLGAYAWAVISQRTPLKIAVMSVQEIDKIRQEKSKSWKEGPLPDWYARKTLVHQVTKDIPKNPKLAAVLKDFEKEDEIESDFEIVPENGSVPATSTEAPQSEPAVAADDTPALDEPEPDLNEMTLDRAMTVPLIGPPGSWQGKVGTLLYTFSDTHLVSIRKWLRDKIEEAGEDRDKEMMATAITLILDARAKDQTSMDLEPANSATGHEAPPPAKPKSTNIKMPPPGKVVDALQSNTKTLPF